MTDIYWQDTDDSKRQLILLKQYLKKDNFLKENASSELKTNINDISSRYNYLKGFQKGKYVKKSTYPGSNQYSRS